MTYDLLAGSSGRSGIRGTSKRFLGRHVPETSEEERSEVSSWCLTRYGSSLIDAAAKLPSFSLWCTSTGTVGYGINIIGT